MFDFCQGPVISTGYKIKNFVLVYLGKANVKKTVPRTNQRNQERLHPEFSMYNIVFLVSEVLRSKWRIIDTESIQDKLFIHTPGINM